MIAYKLCKKKNGKYYPLYVNTDKEFILGEKYYATPGTRLDNGKVKSSIGPLAYRPGIHLSDISLADHIGKRGDNGELLRRTDTAWLECEVSNTVDYTDEAKKNPNKCLDDIPYNGFYWFNTNTQAKANWIIADSIIPIREISREEEIDICHAAGFEAQGMES